MNKAIEEKVQGIVADRLTTASKKSLVNDQDVQESYQRFSNYVRCTSSPHHITELENFCQDVYFALMELDNLLGLILKSTDDK